MLYTCKLNGEPLEPGKLQLKNTRYVAPWA